MRLTDYLSTHGISIGEFATEVGVNQTTIYRFINGSRRPSWDAMAAIYKATKGAVSAEDWLHDAFPDLR